jgi:hypothetical protein
MKIFQYAETTFTEILGDVSIEVSYAGTRGRYKTIAEHAVVATLGSVTYGPEFSEVESYLAQSRTLKTPAIDRIRDADNSSCSIESKFDDWIDVGFSLVIAWTGQAALRSYRIFADPHQETGTGVAEVVEPGPNILVGTPPTS